MTWIKLDDNAVGHPKVAGLSDRAFRLWIRSLCYASEFLTDGALPAYFLKREPQRYQLELIASGLWEKDADGNLVIHDYLVHQSSRDYVLQERDMKRRRSAFHRDDSLKEKIRLRDGDNCRYCGRTVNWTDRRGPRGGTYDHVIPRGPETLENLVVACRLCNNSKGPRTPEQAGMTLIQPRTNLGQTQNELRTENREQITDTENRTTTPSSSHGPALVMSPKEFDRLRETHAFVGSKLRVPKVLHFELLGKSGADAERELQRWYLQLNDQLEESGKGTGDVFAWLRPRHQSYAILKGWIEPAPKPQAVSNKPRPIAEILAERERKSS